MTDLDKLEALAKAATQGPWEQSHREGDDEMYRTQVYTADGETIASLAWYPKDMGGGRIGTYRDANAAYIAAANPATILDLIASARRDAEEIERLRAALEPFAAFAQVAEAKSRMALGEVLPDTKILTSLSWEGGLGVLVMGHFRDALSFVPKPKGWSGLYRRARAAHTGEG